MKKRVIFGIVAGALVLNIAAIGIFGAALAKSNSGSMKYAAHDGYVVNSLSANQVSNSKGFSSGESYRNEVSAEAEYGEDYIADENVQSAGGGISNEVNVDPAKGRLLIRTVSMSAETKVLDSVKADLESQVKALGGYIEESSMSGTGSNKNLRTVSYTIRVPADKLDMLISTVGTSCNVLSASENSTDVTLEYVDTKARVESLRVEYEQLMKLLGEAKDLDNIIVLQNRLTEVRYQIESAESRIRVLENQVQFATLYLNLREVLEETVIEQPHIPTYGEKVSEQFKLMWENTVIFFQDFVLGLIACIPFIIFMAVVAVIVLVIVFGARKKRRARIAKAQALKEEEKKASEEKKEDNQE